MILTKDILQTTLRVSQALWGETTTSLDLCTDTLATVQLLGLDQSAFLKRSIRALVERSERESEKTNSDFLNQSLYRIHPLERALLVLLYEFQWTGDLLTETFEISADELDTLIWKSKLDLLTHRSGGKLFSIPTPRGITPQCPEWNGSRPWTARYLDQRLSRADQIFVHGHVDGCTNCRSLLEQSRTLLTEAKTTYEASMPEKPTDKNISEMMKILGQGETYALGKPLPAAEAFRQMVRQRKDVQLVIIGLIGWMILRLTQ
ncbi:MAG: hypothetical protein KA715_11165 [Xanthomonadaceae bacterium]|nr:hypothetical protein [Xanthomonadaceae bacterium]